VILHIPAAHSVIQRNRNGLGAIPTDLSAEAPRGSEIYARVLPMGKSGRHASWERIGTLKGGRFKGVAGGVPTGGPYQLQVRIGRQVASVDDILVGDLYILAGQSNMDGCGKLVNTEPPSRMVHCFYFNDYWDIARDPLCRYNEAIDPIHWRLDGQDREIAVQQDRDFRSYGAGLGVRFGKEIHKRHGVPIGLIACSQGGTRLAEWRPSELKQGDKSLYGSMIRRVKAVGGRVAACLWYQGESDAQTDEGLRYRADLRALIEAVRKDLKQPRLPWLQVQLGPHGSGEDAFPHWNKVQAAQIAVEADLPNVATVAAADLDLCDSIHISTRSQKMLAVRLAHLADRLVYGDRQKQIGPRFKSARVSKDRRWVAVKFNSVNGTLRPKSGFWGFSIEAEGVQIPIPTRKVEDRHTVLLGLRDPLPGGAVLWYGRGGNPTVGLRDSAGLPCPVFGPVAL